jgi:asparagine synthase (glutamine-hydrolysing)
MCGFAGCLIFDNNLEIDSQIISKMIDIQKHRGPDDACIAGLNFETSSYEIKAKFETLTEPANLLFGFNRLSIQDLSLHGRQPMVSPDGNTLLMMNGEIYNASDFRSLLVSKGYVFKGHTDTEVALYLYCEFGIEKMLQMLNGMFAFAIADLRNKRVFIARDRFGIKPIYFFRSNSIFAFSSEIKSFLCIPNQRFELDEDKLDEFLLFRNLINQTLIKGISNLVPGTFLEVNQYGESAVKVFYSIDSEGKHRENSQNTLSLEEILKNSVNSQMISDVKLGSQLSGGVDSTLVSYYSSLLKNDSNLETVSVVFENQKFSEEAFIDLVTEKLNLKSHKFVLNSNEFTNSLNQATWHFEQPLNHPNTIGLYLLCKGAKEFMTVLLSGEGADEVFAGYSRFVNEFKSPYLSKSFLSKLRNNKNNLIEFIRVYSDKNNQIILGNSFSSIQNSKRLYSRFNIDNAIKKRKEIINSLNDVGLNKQRKYEILTYLPDLLIRQDKMSMAHSIENRVPFLDNDLVSRAFSLKEDDLIRKINSTSEGKYILKKLCADQFGNSFAFRDKMGFGIPLRQFFGENKFKELWHDEIYPGIKKRGIFNHLEVKKDFEKLDRVKPDQLDAIWLMSSFEIWAKQYL